jgi:hypothetical protein
MIYKQVLASLMAGNWPVVLLTGIAYVFATTEGSVKMMKILLAREKGSHKVGASANAEEAIQKAVEKVLAEKGLS